MSFNACKDFWILMDVSDGSLGISIRIVFQNEGFSGNNACSGVLLVIL